VTALEIDLAATSRSGDAGYLAAHDLAGIADELGLEYRLVGGVSVALLTQVHGVADRVPARETADADFGADTATIGDERLARALLDHGYVRVEGNRFTREARRAGDTLPLAVDLLTPSYTGRLETNVGVGDLSVDAVPALGLALAAPPTAVRTRLTLTDGEILDFPLALPDVSAALSPPEPVCVPPAATGGFRPGSGRWPSRSWPGPSGRGPLTGPSRARAGRLCRASGRRASGGTPPSSGSGTAPPRPAASSGPPPA
jgi:hypothetical protein